MDDIDIDDYSRDRSRSPVRNRSKSPENSGRRDYEAPRGGARRGDRRDGGGKHDRSDERGGYSRRGRGERRDRGENRDGRSAPIADEQRPKVDRNYDNSVFVGNIPFRTTSRDIQDMFGSDFQIVRADIVTHRGRSRGMATVEFASKNEVLDAISKFDRTSLDGREIFVRQDYPPPEARRRNETYGDDRRSDRREERPPREKRERFNPAEPPKPGTELFVGNLPFSTTWQSLKDMMRTAGDVLRADVMQTKWGKSRGFGTVVFSSPEEANSAIEKFNGHNLEGRQIEVRHGKDISERRKPIVKNSEFTEGVEGDGNPSNLIHAGNLPFITTETDLYELFETIGRVNRAEIQYNDRGRPNGTAVVEFESQDLADLAIQNLDGYNYGGRDLRITYASKSEVSDSVMEEEPDVSDKNIENEAVVVDEDITEAPGEIDVQE